MDITFSFRSKDLKSITDSMSETEKSVLYWFVGSAMLWKERNPTGSIRDFWEQLSCRSYMDAMYYKLTDSQRCVIDFFICKIILEDRFLENDQN